jgi:hypothetical protein
MFKPINNELKPILNSEGNILTIKKLKRETDEHDMFLEAIFDQGKKKVYTKITVEALKLYFNSRLRLFEIFLIRSDEPYFIFSENKFQKIIFGDKLKNEVINTIECGMLFYSDISSGMKSDPLEIIRNISLFYN